MAVKCWHCIYTAYALSLALSIFFPFSLKLSKSGTLFQLRWRGGCCAGANVKTRKWRYISCFCHQSQWEMLTLSPTNVKSWRYWWKVYHECILKHGWIKTSQTKVSTWVPPHMVRDVKASGKKRLLSNFICTLR